MSGTEQRVFGGGPGREGARHGDRVQAAHYFPWLAEQGHSPNAWSVLGAVAQATERLPLMTYVTCPIRRYHPAVGLVLKHQFVDRDRLLSRMT